MADRDLQAVPKHIEPEPTPVFDVPIPRSVPPDRPGRTAETLGEFQRLSHDRHDALLASLKNAEAKVLLQEQTVTAVAAGIAEAAGAVALVRTTKRLLKIALWLYVPLLGALGSGFAAGASFVFQGFKDRPTLAEVRAIAAAAATSDIARLQLDVTRLSAEAESARRENQVLREEIRDLRRSPRP